jgi:hypothetical protein
MRHLFVAGLLIGSLIFAGTDLSACGDKSLSAGGIRIQRAIAARFPASILIYAPPASPLQGAVHELNLQKTLRLVGHQYREVATASDLQAALSSGQYNVVLADVADAADLQHQLQSSALRVAVVSVAYKLSRTETDAAARRGRFLIKAPSHPADYLMTIADAVRAAAKADRKA